MYQKVLRLLGSRLSFPIEDKTYTDSEFAKILNTYSHHGSNEIQNAQIECLAWGHAYMLMNLLGFRKISRRLGKELVFKCKYYSFNFLGLTVAHKLARDYGFYDDYYLYKEKSELVRHFMECIQLEVRSQEVILEIIHMWRSMPQENKENAARAKELLEPLSEQMGQITSFRFNHAMYYGTAIMYEMLGWHERVYETCMEAYHYFSSLEFDHVDFRLFFLGNAIDKLVFLDRTEEALVLVQKFDSRIYQGLILETIKSELIIKILIAEDNFTEAETLFMEVSYNPSFEELPKNTQERFQKLSEAIREARRARQGR